MIVGRMSRDRHYVRLRTCLPRYFCTTSLKPESPDGHGMDRTGVWLRTVPAVVGQDPFADPGAAMNVPPGVDASRTNTAEPSIET